MNPEHVRTLLMVTCALGFFGGVFTLTGRYRTGWLDLTSIVYGLALSVTSGVSFVLLAVMK